MKEARHRRVHSVWVCLHELDQAKLGDRNQESGGMWVEAGKGHKGAFGGPRNIFRFDPGGGYANVITGQDAYLHFVQ